MMWTKALLGKELKQKTLMKQDRSRIGHWAYSIYLQNDYDVNIEDILLTLNTMEDGPEFYFTYEELDKIADDLIAGREVKKAPFYLS